MGRRMLRMIVAIFTFLMLAAVVGATYEWFATRRDLAATPPPGRIVDIGGHRLHLWCTGEGAPAVILESGLGSSNAAWGFVQPEVAQFTRVCSYDRAGTGYSDPGPSPRTARRITTELVKLADRGGIKGPVVVVAASSGGFNARILASDGKDVWVAVHTTKAPIYSSRKSTSGSRPAAALAGTHDAARVVSARRFRRG